MEQPVVLIGIGEMGGVFARLMATDAITLQAALYCEAFDHKQPIATMLSALEHIPDHKCMDRSAPARLARALVYADRLGSSLAHLQRASSRTHRERLNHGRRD